MLVIGSTQKTSSTVLTKRCNRCNAPLGIQEYDVQLETYTEQATATDGPLAGQRATLTRQYHYVRCACCGAKLELCSDDVPARVRERLREEYWSMHGPE